ncbi:MAG: hypothetical protein ACE5IL_16845 [Myxococcota bacterium]
MSSSESRGFDPTLAGKRAECDGGGLVAGTHFAGREDYAGTLTGEYVEEGDPPWRWYLLTDLTLKPEGYPGEAVWCESGHLFVVEGGSSRARPPRRANAPEPGE